MMKFKTLTFSFLLLLSSLFFGQDGNFIRLLVFRDGDVREIAMAVARATGINIVVDSSVSGNISLHLRNVSAEEVLSLIAQAVGGRLVKTESGFLLTKQPQAPILQVEFKEGKVTVNAQNADASEVLRQVAEKGKLNLILPSDLPQSKVTVSLRDLEPEEAANLVAKSVGWEVQKEVEVLRVQRIGFPSQPPTAPATAPTPPPPISQPVQKPTPSPSLVERPKEEQVEVQQEGRGLVTLNAINAPLSQVLDEISRQTGSDILFIGSSDEKVTVRLKDVPIEDALRLILAGTKYTFIEVSDGGKVEKKSGNPQRQRFLIGEWGDPSKWTSPTLAAVLETKRFPLKYLKAEQVPQILSPAIPTGIVKVISDQNAILVTGPREFLERVEKELEQADNPPKQVIIEALVLEVSERAIRQLGVIATGQKGEVKGEFGTSTFPGLLFTLQGDNNLASQFFLQLQAMIERGEAKTLARPKVATVSGKKAVIEVIQELYFRTAPFFGPTPQQPTPVVPFFQLQAISAGVKLELTPMVGEKGEILLEISPEVSSVVGLTTEGLPQLSTRRATATLWVRDGQTVVLGGLRQREEMKVKTQVPILSGIPILGEIFKSHRKEVRENELLILLTPQLLRNLSQQS